MQKVLLAFLAFTFSSLLLAQPALAQKSSAGSKSPAVQASIARNRKSVLVSFSNLTNTKTIRYTLTYNSNGGPQGASGTIKAKKKTRSLSRRLLFGTCSKNVCTYHKNVSNVKLNADFTLNSGGILSFEKNL